MNKEIQISLDSKLKALRELSKDTMTFSLQQLTDEDRLDIFKRFCRHCGSLNPKCVCSRDE